MDYLVNQLGLAINRMVDTNIDMEGGFQGVSYDVTVVSKLTVILSIVQQAVATIVHLVI